MALSLNTFDPMKTKISLKGIVRSVDLGISEDGQALELINARVKDGSIKPIGRPAVLGDLNVSGEIKCIKYHPASDRYIIIADKVYASPQPVDGQYSPYQLPEALAGSTRVDILNNVLVFTKNVSGEYKPLYAIWSEGGYKYLGESPDTPSITITCAEENLSDYSRNQDPDFGRYRVSEVTDETYYKTRISGSDIVPYEQTMAYASDGLCRKILYRFGKEGFFGGCNFLLVRLAYKLSDSSYYKHSQIFLFDADRNYTPSRKQVGSGGLFIKNYHVGYFYSGRRYTSGNSKQYVSSFSCGFRPTITLAMPQNLPDWEGFITQVDVFVHPVQNYKTQVVFDAQGDQHEELVLRSASEIEDEIRSTSQFYLYESYDIHGKRIWKAEDLTGEQLALNDRLKDDDATHNVTTGQTSYVYNGRLHVGNIDETFYNGYPLDYSNGSKVAGNPVDAYTRISTPEGVKIVKNQTSCVASDLPILSYPDARATDITIGTKKFNLERHKSLNMALNVGNFSKVNDTAEFEYSDVTMEMYFDGEYSVNHMTYHYARSLALSDGTSVIAPSATDNTTRRAGVVKVSSLNNPLHFPADQTYAPSSGYIIGLCSNTTALSQGQHGQNPVYIFCSDGIYALKVGSGDIAYAGTDNVSRDICTGLIRGIDSSVIFSSERGLMSVKGIEVSCLSDNIDGWLSPILSTNEALLTKIANSGTSQAYRTDLANSFSIAEFRNYIKGADIGYNYTEAEIIVSNTDYNYSYVYGVRTGEWYKLSDSFLFVDRYPLCLGYRSGMVFDLDNPKRTINKILLMTRPIKFSSTNHKRVTQTALRGLLIKSHSNLYLRGEQVNFRGEPIGIFHEFGFYVLGSNDGEHFTLLAGKELNDSEIMRDFITPMTKTKPYKYFMVCVSGGVRSDVALNCLEFDVEQVYDNRIR